MKQDFSNNKANRVIKIDPAYIYEMGAKLRALLNIPEQDSKKFDIAIRTQGPREALLEFTFQTVFRQDLAPVEQPARELLEKLDLYEGDIFSMVGEDTDVGEWQIRQLKDRYRAFESVLYASLRMSQMYYVSPKGGYNTAYLTDAGEMLFSNDLPAKVPEAVGDLREATKCIAFELPTAAGFHLHRANESVLRAYWDCVTNGAKRPPENNMGVYLRELNNRGCGKKSVRDHLKSIKDFHRNPLMHPEQSLQSVDEALDLLAAIRSSIGYMLAEIDFPTDKNDLLNDLGA